MHCQPTFSKLETVNPNMKILGEEEDEVKLFLWLKVMYRKCALCPPFTHKSQMDVDRGDVEQDVAGRCRCMRYVARRICSID